ncbi:hypothetical protein BDV98DRAFT_602537 [Pterulicium gracile]|uniref:Uncharacterized protein n=1 Tax=Pterulicium gracile TaxID=1884261 RepID=A0A5C3QU51_9AGAR|nr:hypothetical protein BDV98DRAFT_602537 [Pterula gracilis]
MSNRPNAQGQTTQVPAPAVQLCQNCQLKPRYGSHKHCGKTCSDASKAAKAASSPQLCVRCKKKPKFGNFDYCGKNCAAQAGVGQGASQPTAQKKKKSSSSQASTSGLGAAAVPVAQAIAQALLPQVQAAAAAALSANPALKPIVTALNTSGAAANALNVIQTQYPSLDLSGLTGVPAAGLPRVNTGGAKFVAPAPSTGPRPKCRIPNCKEIVYVDNEGVYGEFCSQLCREEAVDTDLVSPCIMCMSLPHGRADHFCSRVCREDALSKPLPRATKN